MMIAISIPINTNLNKPLTTAITMMMICNSRATHLSRSNPNSRMKTIISNHHPSIISKLTCNLLTPTPSKRLSSRARSTNPLSISSSILSFRMRIKAMVTTHCHCILLKLPAKTCRKCSLRKTIKKWIKSYKKYCLKGNINKNKNKWLRISSTLKEITTFPINSTARTNLLQDCNLLIRPSENKRNRKLNLIVTNRWSKSANNSKPGSTGWRKSNWKGKNCSQINNH